MTQIYSEHGYNAVVDRTGTVVVTRHRACGDILAHMTTHVGEKHQSQDWREVVLCGCPVEIKREIAKAHLTYMRQAVA